uniref:Dominulin-B n=1 Tax=Polistes dominula TaxID=743375 RepID=MASTB_POLDO|nr:RecName: Full=Dominulin-B [Polistes dominula]
INWKKIAEIGKQVLSAL